MHSVEVGCRPRPLLPTRKLDACGGACRDAATLIVIRSVSLGHRLPRTTAPPPTPNTRLPSPARRVSTAAVGDATDVIPVPLNRYNWPVALSIYTSLMAVPPHGHEVRSAIDGEWSHLAAEIDGDAPRVTDGNGRRSVRRPHAALKPGELTEELCRVPHEAEELPAGAQR